MTKEKAKRYDEALEIAKKNYITAQDLFEGSQIGVECFKNTLESIFPELKESEDERMWKLIKKYVHYNISDMALNADHITREQLESWLEKQGESNPYEETMVEQKKDYEEWFLTDYLEFENNDDTWADEVEVNLGKDYEIQNRGDKTFIVKKKPQYPKTYKECCEVLGIPKNSKHYIDIDVPLVPSDYNRLVSAFTKLLICRDAYWKIAGEQMGLLN